MKKLTLLVVLFLSISSAYTQVLPKFNLEFIARYLVSADEGRVHISPSGQLKGELLPPNDPQVTKLSKIIIRLTHKYAWETVVNGKELPPYAHKADMIVALVTGIKQELQRYGISVTTFNIMEGMSQLPTLDNQSFISKYLTVYAQQRQKGFSHMQAINQIHQSVTQLIGINKK